MIIGKTIRERLEEIEMKIKILIENNLQGTTPYLMLVNSKMLLKDQLANDLILTKDTKDGGKEKEQK